MLDRKRREFIALVGGGGLLLATKARRARAQQAVVPVVGFLNSASAGPYRQARPRGHPKSGAQSLFSAQERTPRPHKAAAPFVHHATAGLGIRLVRKVAPDWRGPLLARLIY
jgi:hypothetical protein